MIPIHPLVHSSDDHITWAGPGQNQEPGTSLISHRGAGAQGFGSLYVAFPRLLAGRRIGTGTAVTQTSTHSG